MTASARDASIIAVLLYRGNSAPAPGYSHVPQPLETWGAVGSFDKTFRTMAAYTASVETVVARDENGSVNGKQGGLQGGEEVRQKDEPAAPAAALAAAPMAAEEAGSGDMQMRGAVEVPDDEGRSDNDADTSSYGNLDGRSVVTTKGIVKVSYLCHTFINPSTELTCTIGLLINNTQTTHPTPEVTHAHAYLHTHFACAASCFS